MGQMVKGSQPQELRSMHTTGQLQGSETAAVASGPDGYARHLLSAQPWRLRVKIWPTAVSVREQAGRPGSRANGGLLAANV